MEKRIQREIKALGTIGTSYRRVTYEHQHTRISYRDSTLRANIELYIKNYPFKCPVIYINKYNYTNLLNYNPILDCCLCCESITCSDNWNLSLKLTDIDNEIEKNLKLKNHTADLICMTNMLKHKMLPKELEMYLLTYI